MVESGRKKGSTIINFDKEGRNPQGKKKEYSEYKKKKHKENCIYIIAIFLILILFIVVVFLTIAYNCVDAILAWLADKLIELVAGGAVIELVVVCFGYNFDKKNSKDITIVNKALAGGTILIFFLLLCLLIKVVSIVAEKELQITSESVENSENSSKNIESNREIITTYILEQDIYMENYPLELYYGKTISDGEREDVMVEILLRDLNRNKQSVDKSSYYVQLTETADVEYNTYLYIRNMEVEIENENVKKYIFDDCIDMLKKSLGRREDADKECKIVENERPLAAGYKEIGDMYVQKKMQNEAIAAYENSSRYYIKAIYYAAAQGNTDEMDKCMKQFEKLGNEVEKLDEISAERRDKILQMISVYKKFKEKYASANKGV